MHSTIPGRTHKLGVMLGSVHVVMMVHSSCTQYMRARKLLHQAKEGFSGYEFEARLNFQVHSSLGFIQSVHPE